jgi:hypothetical protein
VTPTVGIWALTGALLILAAVIAIVGYVWATTGNLDRLTEADVLAMLRDDKDWVWPQLDEAEREARHDYLPEDEDRPTARELADDDLATPEGRAA